MDTNTVTPAVAAATLASVHAGNRNLSFHEQNDVALHSGAGVSMARVAQFILGPTDIRDCVPFLMNRDNVI